MNIVTHTFAPVYNEYSKVLILGTLPSPKSRENGFYYGHPQNLFWRVMATVFEAAVPVTVSEKTDFLLSNKIALWDVIESCEISGASDSSIKNPVCNDFGPIIKGSEIRAVFTTGSTATKLYEKHCYSKTLIHTKYLPSTSPANKRHYDFEKLISAYSEVRSVIESYNS